MGAFFSLLYPLSGASLIQDPQGGATLLIFQPKHLLSCARWGKASLIGMNRLKKVSAGLSHSIYCIFIFSIVAAFLWLVFQPLISMLTGFKWLELAAKWTQLWITSGFQRKVDLNMMWAELMGVIANSGPLSLSTCEDPSIFYKNLWGAQISPN